MNEREFFESIGEDALKYYHIAALMNYPENYQFSYEQLLDYVKSVSPDFLYFFGKTIDAVTLSPAELKSINEYMVEKTQGKVPAKSIAFQSFFDAVNDELQSVDHIMWLATKDVVGEVSSGVKKAFKLAPALLILVGLAVLYKKL